MPLARLRRARQLPERLAMADISHTFGNDIDFDASGDVALSDGSDMGRERILRRLLTNPGEYIWHGQYGAGLARFLGQTTSGQSIQSVARGQIFKEAAVSRTPSPAISVTKRTDGSVILSITYTDAVTKEKVLLTAPVGGV